MRNGFLAVRKTANMKVPRESKRYHRQLEVRSSQQEY